MRHWKLALFILAVLALCFLPNPEYFIVKAVERAGLLLLLVRGIKGYYDDFKNAF